MIPALPQPAVANIPTGFGEFIVAARRHLHRNPEIGFQEHGTSAYIRRTLEENGLQVHGPIAGTGLFVDIGGRGGRAVGYRADIDALPAHDAKTVEYASRNPGAAHLCGHDAHTAIALGTALLLSRRRDSLHGTIRIFFQPNEEGTPGGAVDMIRDGVLQGLEAVYAVHVDPSIRTGVYGLLTGPITASNDVFRVQISAQASGHSARPHDTVDTIWTATQIMNTLYQLVGRVTDARNPAVLTICRFQAGDAYNVIPAQVEFGGTLRATNKEDRTRLAGVIERVAAQFAEMHGAASRVEIVRGSPPVNNDQRMVELLEATIRRLYGDAAVFRVPRPSMGAEDFAHYLEHLPGALLRVGTCSGASTSRPLHDSHFDVDEGALAPAAVLMADALAAHLERNIISQ
ncbi:MAG: amidohydrolase [Rhodothermales bacterium]